MFCKRILCVGGLAIIVAAAPLGVVRGQEVVEAGKMRVLKGHKHAADALVFSADSKRLFSGSLFDIKIWDVEKGKDLRTIKAHTQYVKALAVSRDGKQLISGSWDAALKMGERCVKIWDLKGDAKPESVWTADVLVHSVALSPNEKYFATGGRDKTLRIWDFPSGKLRVATEAHPRDIQCVAFSPDSKLLASCGYDSETKVWEAATGKPLWAIPNVGTQFHWDAVEFSPDGKHLAMSGSGLRVIEVEGGKEVVNVRPDQVQTTSLAWSPDGKLIATGGMDQVLKIYDATSGKELAALKDHKSAIQVVRFSPDGRWIATGAQNDADIRLWPLVTPAAKNGK
jgi:WD40 repeat protein